MIIDFLKDKPKPAGKKRLITMKITGEELLLLKVKAAKFTDGNVSEWLRYAGMYLLPPISHLDFGAYADPDEMEFYGPNKDENSLRYDALRKELKSFARKYQDLERQTLIYEDEECE